MKIYADEEGALMLEEVYNGIGLKTDAGVFAVCMRDNGIEIKLGDGPWYTWQDATGPQLMGGDCG